MESRHNAAYWNGTPYLGIGPSAHSFNKTSRQWNVSHLEKYISGLEQNRLVFETETLTTDQKYNEYIMTSLRISKGIDTEFVKNEYGGKFLDHLSQSLQKYKENGWLELLHNTICLTDEGKLFSDLISAELFVSSEAEN